MADRRQARELRESEQRLSMVFHGVSDLLALVEIHPNHRYRLLRLNQAYDAFLDSPRKENEGRYIEDLGPPDWRDRVVGMFDEAVRTRSTVTTDREETSPAGLLTLTTDVIPIVDESDRCTHLLVVSRNITEQKAANRALRYRLAFEEIITRLSTEFITLPSDDVGAGIDRALDALGRFAEVDRSYIFLFSNHETMSCVHEWCAPGVEPQIDHLQNLRVDDFAWFAERIRRHEVVHIPRVSELPDEAGTERGEFERQGIRSLIDVPMISSGRLVGLLGFETVNSETSWPEDVIALLRIVGEIVANALDRRHKDQAIKRHQEDLEEQVRRRTRELEEAQDELVKRERLAVLGRLTATVSHEIRNPLGTIRNSIHSIAGALEAGRPEKAARPLELAERNIRRCVEIIEELLEYSKTRAPQSQETDVDPWLAEVMAAQSVPEGLEILLQLDSSMSTVFDPGRLERAVANVVTNAFHALEAKTSGARRLTVNTRREEDRLLISFEDTGSGMPEEVAEKALDPLFSTKTYGVGLGLPIVKDILEQHGGGVEIRSEEGRGTTVVLWVPLVPRLSHT